MSTRSDIADAVTTYCKDNNGVLPNALYIGIGENEELKALELLDNRGKSDYYSGHTYTYCGMRVYVVEADNHIHVSLKQEKT